VIGRTKREDGLSSHAEMVMLELADCMNAIVDHNDKIVVVVTEHVRLDVCSQAKVQYWTPRNSFCKVAIGFLINTKLQ